MAAVELSEAFFQKIAGWEAVKHARALLATGKVLSSNWTPPILKGVVVADDSSYRAGLSIKDSIDIENMCTCRQSRQWGTICAHSVAVGLHYLKIPASGDDTPAAPTKLPGKPGTAIPAPTAKAIPTKDPLRIRRTETGESLEIHIILPPNLMEAAARGRVMVVFEGATQRARSPLNVFAKSGSYSLSPADAALLDAAELICGGDTPGMAQLTTKDFVSLLPVLNGHPNLTLAKKQRLQVSLKPVSVPLRATLESNGEILLSAKGTATAPTGTLAYESSIWTLIGTEIRPVQVPPSAPGILQGPVRIPRIRVPEFLSRDWAPLLSSGQVEANFRLEDFVLEQAPPKFILNLAGGLAQLTGTLQCAYGSRIMTVGVTARDEVHWLPDPTNAKRYSTRDLGSEHRAFMRLRQAGFTGPNVQGQWQLLGQDRVLTFFAREHPKLEKVWEIHLEERLDRSTKQNIEHITPELRVIPSGEQWFDLEVAYTSTGGERFSPVDIQELLRGNGSKRLKNGKFAVIDTGAVEELQEVLLDCNPQQQSGSAGVRYKMSSAQAGYLENSTTEHGLTMQAPAAWSERARKQKGEAKLICPPLGNLEEVLRPYQKHGVAWLGFLRENLFGGILADEMGLGKTLQVLAHLRASRTNATSKRLPCLVVCPTSLVFNWIAEAKRFTPELKTVAISGSDRQPLFAEIATSDLVVTSYALIRRDLEQYKNFEFDTVALDEAQHIKNRKTQNAQAVKALRSRYKVVLTGTPLENSVLDLWSIYDFLMPGYLGTAKDFQERYEIPIAREKDANTMARLAKRVRPFLLRRLKRDVVKELPDKLEQIAFCDLTDDQAAIYQQVLNATRKEVLDQTSPQAGGGGKNRLLVLTALLRLRQICCDARLVGVRDEETDTPSGTEDLATTKSAKKPSVGGKVQLFTELLDEVIDGGHRVLVFSQFTSMLRLLREQLEADEIRYCYLDGSTKDRAAVVDQFQNDSGIPVFLISLKAGGTGLNLTGADTVMHFDPWWNPAAEDQATDRAHRIGQTRVVTSYKLIARGTVEEKILNLQRRKRELISATLTGEAAFTESLSWDEIQELLG
ncbi:MAG TPA: SNF2-related protein [Candidatus Limnocylindria bacterium]|nr:SNF2-related protein [Candidatus Limnocylindria bacterium]